MNPYRYPRDTYYVGQAPLVLGQAPEDSIAPQSFEAAAYENQACRMLRRYSVWGMVIGGVGATAILATLSSRQKASNYAAPALGAFVGYLAGEALFRGMAS